MINKWFSTNLLFSKMLLNILEILSILYRHVLNDNGDSAYADVFTSLNLI